MMEPFQLAVCDNVARHDDLLDLIAGESVISLTSRIHVILRVLAW